jgi:uncharacterized protein (DUF433 family)
MELPDFLTVWPGDEIMLTGHRIGLYHVVKYHNRGESAEQLHERFPTLSPGLIGKVLDFYDANREEVDAYVALTKAELDRQEAAAPRVDVEAIRRRLEEKKRQAGS